MEAYCPHNPSFSGGHLGLCDWTGPIASLKQHLETQCLDSLIRCPNNCSSLCCDEDISKGSRSRSAAEVELFSLAELHEHRKELCPLEPTDCPNACGHATMARKEVHEHVQRQCPLTYVLCPNECGDGACFPRQELPEHLQETCPNRKLKCPILSSTQEVMAWSLERHVKEANAAHFESAHLLNANILELLWKDLVVRESLLAASIRSRSFQVLRAIVRHSIDTDHVPIHFKRDDNGRDMLGRAVHGGDVELVKELLECDESKEVVLRPQMLEGTSFSEHLLNHDSKEALPLSLAIRMHHREVAELVFETMVVRAVGGFTPLMLACFVGDVAKVRLLLKHTVVEESLVAQDDLYQNTALMWACYFNQLDALKSLLEKGCSGRHLLLPNRNGLIPLQLASMRGYSKLVATLLKDKFLEEQLLAQDNLADANALIFAIGCHQTKVVRLLLEADSSKKQLLVRSGQHTALTLAHVAHLEAVQLLLNAPCSDEDLINALETMYLDERRSEVKLEIVAS